MGIVYITRDCKELKVSLKPDVDEDIFSTVILASHSSHSLSPLGVAMRSSQLPIGSF